MNDRELLELAAKAVGFGAGPPDNPHCWTESEYPRGSGKHGALWSYMGYSDTAELWNPLYDDGDALRLARTLQFVLDFDCEEGVAVRHSSGIKIIDPKYRRAIVRAAAEIGKGMK